MISKPVFVGGLFLAAVVSVGVVMYQRSRAEVAALRAQIGGPAAPVPGPAPSLGAVGRPAAATPPSAAPAAANEGQEFLARLHRAATLDEALRLALPLMDDTLNKESDGAVMLALWASDHMKWADVAVAKNETSIAKILKDSDANRGKRMCLSGSIIQIAKQRGTDLYSGLLNGFYGAGIVRFFVAGDTGDLVEDSETRLCGVATGRYVYSNSGGGTTHAVSLVGMFDLPKNNPARRRHRGGDVDDE